MYAAHQEYRRFGMPGRALTANRVPLCALLCSSECPGKEPAEPRDLPGVGKRVEAEGEPPRPPLGPRRVCHWPGRPGGREDDISGRLYYKGLSGAAGSERTQPALCSTGTRSRTAARAVCSASACPSTRRPRALLLPPVCAPGPHRHHAPLPAAGLRPAAHATFAPGLRSQARGATEGRCCRGDVGTVRGLGRAEGLGGCSAQEGAERAGRQP